MADLDPLIRVRRHAVEQKQKFLAELYRQAEEMQAHKSTLLSQLEAEQKSVQDMGVEYLSYFGPYSEAVKTRVADIDAALTTLEKRIEIAREDMREAFSELKKVETVQENREGEVARVLTKKESDEMDAIGIEAFRRGREEES